MTDDQLFGLANAVPLVGWSALLLAPFARNKLIAAARVVAVALTVGYALCLAAATAAGERRFAESRDAVWLAHVFSTPRVMLVGLVHYLAFGLWVGAWEAEEAGRRGCRMWP